MDIYPVITRFVSILLAAVMLGLLISTDSLPPGDIPERTRAFTRTIEFDFVDWTLTALGVKLGQSALGSDAYLSNEARRQVVLEYLELVAKIQQSNARLYDIYADPTTPDKHAASAEVRQELSDLQARRARLAPLAEGILQGQVAEIARENGLTIGGQPLPPVLFHSTPLPYALIVSPRDKIKQEADISLVPDLTVDQMAELEEKVDQNLNLSSLVVGIGGVGVYPTMVQQTSSLNWLSEVVAHEWIHNFLTLRPLGINYMTTPEMRTINETAASIAGTELGLAVLERYYPELVPPPQPAQAAQSSSAGKTSIPAEPAPFNFVKEMHTTRVTVDKLLAEGKLEEAEKYMEERRVFFWENGYHIRKINQAYFAFYGAYADAPGGGAAGEDPVGAAVRALRAQSASIGEFVKQIANVSSYAALQELVKQQ